MLSKSEVSLSLNVDFGVCVGIGLSGSLSGSLIIEISWPSLVAFSSSSFRCNEVNFLIDVRGRSNEGLPSFASAFSCATCSASSCSASLNSGSDTCMDSGFKLPNLPRIRGTGPAKNAFSFP